MEFLERHWLKCFVATWLVLLINFVEAQPNRGPVLWGSSDTNRNLQSNMELKSGLKILSATGFVTGTSTITGPKGSIILTDTGSLFIKQDDGTSTNFSRVGLHEEIPQNTDDLDEGSVNFYYTTTRFNTDLATKSSDDLTEGSSNLYFTDARVSNSPDVLSNTSSRHGHANLSTLDTIETTTYLLSQGQIDDIGSNTSSRHAHDNIVILDGITTSSVLSQNEKDALAGSNGVPSSTNVFVTDSDPRLVGSGTSTPDFQAVYDASSVIPQITLGTTQFLILDNASPLPGELFEISDNSNTATHFSVSSSTVFIGGALDNTQGPTLSSTLFLRSIQLIASSTPSYSLRLPLADGSAGQVLSTDGSGNLSFATDANDGGGGGSGSSSGLTVSRIEVVRDGVNPPDSCNVSALLDCIEFDQGSDQDIVFEEVVPSSYASGGDIRLEIKGSSTSSSDVRMILEVALLSDNQSAYADPFTDSSTAGFIITLPTSSGFIFTSTDMIVSTGGSIGTSSVMVGDIIPMRLTREGSADTDTSTGLLNIHEIRVDFQP